MKRMFFKCIKLFNPITLIKIVKRDIVRAKVIRERNKAEAFDFGSRDVDATVEDIIALMKEGISKEFMYSKLPSYFQVWKAKYTEANA